MYRRSNTVLNRNLDLTKNINSDRLSEINSSYKNSIFSYETALYLNNFHTNPGNIIHLTLCNNNIINENSRSIIDYFNMIDINYCMTEHFRIGLIISGNLNNKIYYYDVERSICDILIRDNFSIVTTLLLVNSYKKYQFKNTERLMLYARNFDIDDKVNRVFKW